MSRTFATVLGGYLVVEGVWGLFDDTVFGVLPTNRLRASIHVALGMAGLLAGRRAAASRVYCAVAGAMVGTVGALRFVPGAAELDQRLLNVNPTVGRVNIGIGAASLAVAAATAGLAR